MPDTHDELIAELVAALRAIRHQWAGHSEACAYVQDYDNKCDCDWLKIVAQCDAALAKAAKAKQGAQ